MSDARPPAEDEPTPIAFNETGEGWHLKPKRRVIGYFSAVVVVVLLGGYSLTLIGDGRPVAGVLVLVFVLCLATMPFATSTKRLAPIRLELDGQRGLLLPTHGPRPIAVLALLVVGLQLTGLAVAGGVVAVRDGRYPLLIAVVVLAVVGVFFVGGGVANVVLLRSPSRGLWLLETGPVLRTRADATRLRWEDVARVRPHWSRVNRSGVTTPGEIINNWFSFVPREAGMWPKDPLAVLSGTSDPTFEARTLAVDPYLAVQLCRFYLDNAAARSELSTDAAVARFESLQRSV